MNYLQLVQRLHRESGRSGSGPTTITGATKDHARLFDWVADAWRNLQSRPIDWRWMREGLDGPTTLAQTSYTGADLGASDFGRWRQLSHDYTVKAYLAAAPTQVWRLMWLELDEFKRRFEDQAPAAGQPQFWSISDDDELMIGPQSDVVYQIKAEYHREPSELAADGDEPELPNRHHMILVWAALVQVGIFDNAPDVLSRARDNFAAMEASLIDDSARLISFGGPLA